ncbi:hypothetical protein A9Q84_19665 [Halobacteriovorax marinus]|uniref:GH3 middle domain-containing protein n=1 Tax=Halobacteriovorax marinus TaxID=97084 RepID=A0A1Y5F370_9BACT|nr:hypothetical protein A9Q84_19665 [Halobacteriovorax marinus]
MIQECCHWALKSLSHRKHEHFLKSLSDPELAQKKVLNQILKKYKTLYPKVENLNDFKKKFSPSTYEDWKDGVLKQKSSGLETVALEVEKYEPTSGSTQNVKWIPYTKSFLNELEYAYEPWLFDLYKKYPEINKGTHYWSLSWLPDNLRNQSVDEADLFPFWKRLFLKNLMTLDSGISHLESSQLAQKAALLSLLSKKVSLISIWSPTYLLSLIEMMMVSKDEIISSLQDKSFQKQLHIFSDKDCVDRSIQILKSINSFDSSVSKELFPELKLISMWDTSLSNKWAQNVSTMFAHAETQGKGLWATEGVVTIPFGDKYPLAINSHFYEFENIETKKILSSWELEKDMRVKPLLTSGSGLFRYALNDELRVSDYLEKTPCFEFIGRLRDVDIAGEKLAHAEIKNISKKLELEFNVRTISVFAHNISGKPRKYELLLEGQYSDALLAKVKNSFEQLLLEHFHYRLARELGQLKAAEVITRENGIKHYYEKVSKQIKISGNIKLEEVVVLNN